MVLRERCSAAHGCRIRGRQAYESGGVSRARFYHGALRGRQSRVETYGLKPIAKVKECASDFYAITIERRLKHPVVRLSLSTRIRSCLPDC